MNMEDENVNEVDDKDEYDDMKSVVSVKPQNKNVRFDVVSMAEDIPINKLHKNHYAYRRGSTMVHVQTYDADSASHVVGFGDNSGFTDAVKLTSLIVCMSFVVITFVIKMSSAMTQKITILAEDQYMLVLYSIGFLLASYYNFKWICVKEEEHQFSKSSKSSNRWLKGVIVLFGLAIVLNDVLMFIAKLMVDISNCTGIQISVAVSFMHGLFIISQVIYLFRFSKVYISGRSVGSSIAVMMFIAANLSNWIASIVDETLHALAAGDPHSAETSTHGYNTTSTAQSFIYSIQINVGTDRSCDCHTSFCSTVHTAETFLYPFGVEFSLVAFTLLYVVWQNIGKIPLACEGVIKPSYKFYKEYIGVASGVLAIFVTIIFLILLGTSATEEQNKDYFTEQTQLMLYDIFLIAMETSMLIATMIGCFFFYRVRRPLEKISMLDQVLLGVCVVAPIVLNAFSLIAVIVGPDNRINWWILTLVRPLVEILQCISQIAFIIYGLKREPLTSATSKETAAHLQLGIQEHIKQSSPETIEESNFAYDNKSYLKARRSSVTSVVSRLAHPKIIVEADTCQSHETCFDEAPVSQNNNNSCEVVISQAEGDVSGHSENTESEKSTDSVNSPNAKVYHDDENGQNHSILKIVSETKVARPDWDRTRLRDTIMFLIVTNACLWMFLSLSGTAYTVYQYESLFYGTIGWTIITMMCRPFNIFFRMHSAGCLFEMWSFA